MTLLRLLWKWALRLSFVVWVLLLLLVVLKFYKDNLGSVELAVYTFTFEAPIFILGVVPLLFGALVVVLGAWVIMLRFQLRSLQRKHNRAAKALQAAARD